MFVYEGYIIRNIKLMIYVDNSMPKMDNKNAQSDIIEMRIWSKYEVNILHLITIWYWKKISSKRMFSLTHWGRVTHICVSKLNIIVPDNGLSPERGQAIIWINAGRLLIQTSGTTFSEILNEIHKFSFKKMHLKMSSAKWRTFCLGLNVLTTQL